VNNIKSILHSWSVPFLAVIDSSLGCEATKPTPEQLNNGLIWMFPGIEGGEWSLAGARKAFRDAGVQSAIQTHEWNYPFGWLLNLIDYQANLKTAQEDARQIIQYRRAYPDRPIDLVGYSGGAGVALMVVEALPEDIKVRNVLLVHGAVSPDYNLTEALKRIDGKIINYYSPWDWFILGVGTRLFGTMERVKTDSAGKVGLNPETAIFDPELRPKLIQHRWTKEMFPTGHYGGHFPILSYGWNKNFVAPYLLTD
jgi:pimeloyl-ACP methyl ester carboxylesterase